MTRIPASAAEEFVAELAQTLTEPAPTECVLCYCFRMVNQFGCDNTPRWAGRWRDSRAPRATALLRRLAASGGYCDCEVFLNACELREDLLVVDEETGELDLPDADPSCEGVPARSTQPCGLWVVRRRGW